MKSSVFESLKQEKPLRERIVDAIIDAVLDQRIHPGDKIPEAELAQQLGVSRIPVREAIRIVEHMGLVETRSRAGTYVAKLSLDELEDGYRLRAALEDFAVREALQRPDRGPWRSMCQQLGGLLDQMRAAREEEQWTRVTRLDIEWHTLLVDAASNSALSLAWRSLGLPLRYIVANRGVWPPSTEQRYASVDHHDELLQSLVSEDPEACRAAVTHHCLRRVRPRR